MGYTTLGFLVWKGGKFFLRRRFPKPPRKMVMVGFGGTLLAAGLAGGLAAGVRHRASS
jgi:hypothetical protein